MTERSQSVSDPIPTVQDTDVVLIIPPMAKACEPLLGVATLKSFLEHKGVSCACIDANVEAQHWLLQAERIDAAVEAILANPQAPAPLRKRARSWPSLRPGLESLKDALRAKRTYTDESRYRTTVTGLNRAMALGAAGHDAQDGCPITLTLSNYEDARFCDMASASVLLAAQDPARNAFYGYFKDVLLPRVVALRPKVVGLSFIFRSQLLCGAVLAGMIKQALPETHVTLGGELVSAWVEDMGQTRLPHLADSIIPYEGELGLLGLVEALRQGGGDEAFEAVPNIIWEDAAGTLRKNATQKLHDLGLLPPPDYSWAPWDLYFAPERTAPMVTARGCYWNRCTFCPEVINPETLLRLARVDRLVQDMDTLHERWGITHFHFIDSALPPRTLKGVARYIAEHNKPYTWYGFSRLERALEKPGAAELLARGGCRMLKLGLETGSQRLLDLMDKKQDLGSVSAILNALRDAGIMVHAFLMFGTPFETHKDAELTRQFVAQHHSAIQFINCSLMNLAHGSPMAVEPEKHGINKVTPFEVEGHKLDLALYSNFEGEGWGRVEARRFLHKRFLRDPLVRPLHLRTPTVFDSNHSAFFHPMVFGARRTPRAAAQ